MKKLLYDIKKVTAMFVLAVLLACAISPAIQASENGSNALIREDGLYKAKTTATGYDDRGIPYNIVVYAQVGSSASTGVYKKGVGSVSVKSKGQASKPSMTRHGYGRGTENRDVDIWWNVVIK